MNLRTLLASKPVEASAPCRIDMGGTLDIRSFYLPLRYLAPCTFNLALDLRTHVRLSAYRAGRVKVSSKGFAPAEYPLDEIPFDHPLGFVFAVAAYFRAAGVHIEIESTSPPKSALGGSSAAGVALVGAFGATAARGGAAPFSPRQAAVLAHALEESVAGVPCGLQDQLAAAYGGVHAWHWPGDADQTPFKRAVVVPRRRHAWLQRRILVAYCGVPHVSKDINSRWVKDFLAGRRRDTWTDIARGARRFVEALKAGDTAAAAAAMNRETDLRVAMTPDVLDRVGSDLVATARQVRCGAKFTGAGGGGCLWAVGAAKDIDRLKGMWEKVLSARKDARLLPAKIAAAGLLSTA